MRNVIRFILSIFNSKLPNCWLPRAKECENEDVPSTRFCAGYTLGLGFFDAGPTLTKLKENGSMLPQSLIWRPQSLNSA